jgi:hypothetical protein
MLPALVALAAAVAVHPAPARAVTPTCAKSTDATARAAVFEGSMRAWRHSVRLQMRFRLQARTPDDPVWRAIAAPGFGTWQSAAAGVRRFVYDKRVERLIAPASYRVVLRFRWLDRRGRVVGRARRISAACRQPDPRPDLVVRQLLVTDAGPGRAGYVAVVANTGRTTAGAFGVSFEAVGTPFGELEAAPLAPGATVRVPVEGPACTPGEALAAVVDPEGLVDESDEADNELDTICAYPPASRAHGASTLR